MIDNTYLSRMADQYGAVEHEGRTYVLLQQAYIDGQGRSAYYEAAAVCMDDKTDELNTVPAYLIRWEILPETWDYWDAGGEDEGDACDWERPESVRECGGWDLDSCRAC